MSQQTPPLAAEMKALRDAYAALNRNDIPAMVEGFDPQVEWTEPPEFASEGTYRGLEAVQAHVAQARETWAEGGCEPERFVVAGDKVVALVHVRARLKQETEWREGDLADVYTFRDGRVIEVRTFLERQQALEWAGADASEAN